MRRLSALALLLSSLALAQKPEYEFYTEFRTVFARNAPWWK